MDWKLDEAHGEVWFCQMTPDLALYVWHCSTHRSGEPIEGHHWNYGVAEAPEGPGVCEYRNGTAPTFNAAKLCARSSFDAGPNPLHDLFTATMEDIADSMRDAD